MVSEMKKYEAFLAREIKKGDRSEELFKFHQEKILEFQHERLVHLLIMLFFVFMTVGFLAGTGILFAILPMVGNEMFFGLLCLMDLLLTGLSVGYVRHYYYLENGVQRLYKYTEKLR